MVSIKQIKNLEEKIFRTVELIKAIKQENKILKAEFESANKKVEELEQIISDYRSTQVEFEEGIANAIKQLDELDNTAVNEVVSTVSRANAGKKAEESNLPKNNSSLSEKEDQTEEEVEEIKINYSKISQNKPGSNTAEKKSQNQSAQNETEKSDNNQLDIF